MSREAFEKWWDHAFHFTGDRRDAWDAWQAATAAAVPPGYVVVPVEPTEAMMNAGYDATRLQDGTPQFCDSGFCLGHSEKIYTAMLEAAPKEQSNE